MAKPADTDPDEVTISITFTRWVLTTQADIDRCADAIYASGFASDVHRGHDAQNSEIHSIDIHNPADPTKPLTANLTDVVVLQGGMLDVLTADQYATKYPEAT